MRTLWIALFVLALAGSAMAGGYQIEHQIIDTDLSEYVSTMPVFDNSNELVGFVHSLNDSATIILNLFDSEPRSFTVVRWLVGASACYRGDTLLVFACSLQWGSTSTVTRIAVFDDTVLYDTATAFVLPDWGWYEEYSGCTIAFDSSDGPNSDLIVSLHRYYFEHQTGIGNDRWHKSTTNCYTLDLAPTLSPVRASRLKYGMLREGAAVSRVYFSNEDDSWTRYGMNGSPDQGGYDRDAYEAVVEGEANTLAAIHSADGWVNSVSVGDFTPPWSVDEVILSGKTRGLLGNHAVDVRTTTCYSFASGVAEEVWSIENEPYTYSHVSSELSLMTAIYGSYVVFRNVRNGALVDSVHLDHDFGRRLGFFQTGTDAKVLKLITLQSDTLFVLSFGSPTDVDDDDPPVLPTSFTLHQNYPNPFNAGTVITFDNHISQNITLEVVNALGQRVTSLCDKRMSAGSYRIEWNGRDADGKDLASGVYFARLRTEAEEHSIKMVLVK